MNKIKGSSSAVKMKYLLFVFAAAVLVALPTRVYQLLALVDVTNGFYKESDITIPVLYAIVVVFGFLFLALSFISREVPSPKLPVGKNPVLGIASFFMVGGLAWDMVSFIMKTVPGGTGNVSIFASLLQSNLKETGGAFAILQFIFAFFSIIYFTVFAISHLNGRASYKEFKLLALSPLCWVMTMLVSKLMNAISFIKISELLFEIFMCVFMMLFFLTFARISSGVFTEDSMWGVYGYGLVGALLAAIVTIPRIVIFAVGLNAVEGYEFNFAHLAAMVFILAYVFASLGVGFKDGVKNRKTVNEIDLPDDDEAVLKKADDFEGEGFSVLTDVSALFEEDGVVAFEETEKIDEVEESFLKNTEQPDLTVAEEIEKTVDEPVEEKSAFSIDTSLEIEEDFTTQDEITEVIEETTEEIIEENIEESAENPEEIITEISEEFADETVEETGEAAFEKIVVEEKEEEPKAKKHKLFGKAKEVMDNTEEFAAISLAELKNKQNKE